MTPDTQHELSVALAAVREACALCKSVQSTLITEETLTKKDRSPVTVADYGAQAIVTNLLTKEFNTLRMVGEEDAAELRQPENAELLDKIVTNVQTIEPTLERDTILEAIDQGNDPGGSDGVFWTLDPIDGTKGFLRGEQYAVALARIENGQVTLGVLGCPNLQSGAHTGALFYALRGEGAFCIPLDGSGAEEIHVSDVENPTEASFCESVESGHTSHGHAGQIAERLGVTAPPVRMDSQCKYAAVSRGDASIYLRLPTRPGYQETIWDHAAGVVIIEEAGGRVTDIEGKPLDFAQGTTLAQNRGVIASNGLLHDRVLEAVNAVLS